MLKSSWCCYAAHWELMYPKAAPSPSRLPGAVAASAQALFLLISWLTESTDLCKGNKGNLRPQQVSCVVDEIHKIKPEIGELPAVQESWQSG